MKLIRKTILDSKCAGCWNNNQCQSFSWGHSWLDTPRRLFFIAGSQFYTQMLNRFMYPWSDSWSTTITVSNQSIK